jgi:2,3-dihydroxy-p-cumate/2,3-dihydroxybenzoate 3,4-dioxygenase
MLIMIDLKDIRYLRVGTADLESAITFGTDILGLQLVGQEGKSAYFRSDKVAVRGDTRDHTLVYTEGDPSEQSIGFELKDPSEIDEIAGQLDNAGFPVRAGTNEECESRRVRDMVISTDPTGNNIEIVGRPYHSGKRYYPGRDAGVTEFSHIGLFTTDAGRDESFWTSVFNARVSDWVGEAPFFRINTIHHSVVLFPSNRTGIQHINHQVEDIDDVMRSYYFLKQQGVRIVWGPGRHPVSSAVMVYFEGPDGMTYEYSVGVKHIMPEEEAGYRPRQFPPEKFSLCMWGSEPGFSVTNDDDEKPGSVARAV